MLLRNGSKASLFLGNSDWLTDHRPTNQPTDRRTWGFIGKLHFQWYDLNSDLKRKWVWYQWGKRSLAKMFCIYIFWFCRTEKKLRCGIVRSITEMCILPASKKMIFYFNWIDFDSHFLIEGNRGGLWWGVPPAQYQPVAASWTLSCCSLSAPRSWPRGTARHGPWKNKFSEERKTPRKLLVLTERSYSNL